MLRVLPDEPASLEIDASAMREESDDRSDCFCVAEVNAGNVIVDIVECSDSKDSGERVVRMMNS